MIAGAENETCADSSAGAETGSRRQCALTRECREPEDLVRFVAGPDGQIVPDLARKLPGRGVWVTCSRASVAAAVKGGSFAKALKRKVEAPTDLADLVDRLLAQRAMAALSLANKAGNVVAGFVKVEALILGGDAIALLHAAEAAPDGARKLDAKLASVAAEYGRAPIVIRHFRNAELSLALGRENVVHAAIKSGGAGQAFVREAVRLARYRDNAAPGVGLEPHSDRMTLDTERE